MLQAFEISISIAPPNPLLANNFFHFLNKREKCVTLGYWDPFHSSAYQETEIGQFKNFSACTLNIFENPRRALTCL